MRIIKHFLLSLLMTLCCFQVFAQQGEVNLQGVVYDHLGETAPGVNIYIKERPSVGVATDLDGKFQIKVPVGDILVFTYIGYDDIEYPVTKADNALVIRFKESSQLLDEVIVVGYGVQKKSVLSSAVSRVTSEDLDKGNPTNVQNALKGKVSGVTIISESGQPGSDSKIRIRGTGTVNDSNPLYIVDGMPSSNGINFLNPSDIESIEILKDAASAAIYGARGANGVVLVTTKKGTKSSKATVNYEFTYGIQSPERKVDLMNSEEYQMMMNEMAVNTGQDIPFPTASNVNTDWQKELTYNNAPVVNHKVSVSGGSDKSTYYASFGYISQKGVYAKGYSNYERYNARLNYNTILLEENRKWLSKVTFGSILNYSRTERKGTNIGNSEAGGVIASMNMLPPTSPIYQDDPAKIAEYELLYPNYVKNPDGRVYNIMDIGMSNVFADMQVNNNQLRVPQIFGANFNLDFDLFPGLKFKTTYGMDWYFGSNRRIWPVFDLSPTNKNANSRVEDTKDESFTWQWENILSYNTALGLHNLGLLAGTSMMSYKYSNIKGTDYDLLVVDMDKGYINTATADRAMERVEGGASDHKIASLFARVNYNYDEKYLLEGVIRRDGSSNFGKDHQYAIFPSVSGGWVLTREGFMDSRPDWFDFAKIRASWGQNGNEKIGVFGYTSMMRMGSNAVAGGKVYTGAKTSGYVNPDLKWETSEQTDIGFDLRMFNNAFTFSFDYFNKKTKDMLLDVALPEYTGFTTMKVNQGTVKNEGVELEASYRFNVQKVKFGINANASYVKNEVTNQGDGRSEIEWLGGGLGGAVTWRENGRPYGFFYGYQHDGIFQNWDEVNSYVTSEGKLKQPNAKPGDIRWKDLDGKNGITGDDRTMIGDPNPNWNFGLTLTAEWNNFDFSAFAQGVAGNEIYKFYRRANVANANWEKYWLDRWHGEGTSNWLPRLVGGDPGNNTTRVSDLFIEDGSYLRIKLVQLGYTLPTQLVRKAYIQKLRLFLQGENLYTFTNFTGLDPEVGTRNGFDGGTHPQARTFTIGANIVF